MIDLEPIVEEPEVSVDQPSSPPKTPNLPIQSSDEFEETKPETETKFCKRKVHMDYTPCMQ